MKQPKKRACPQCKSLEVVSRGWQAKGFFIAPWRGGRPAYQWRCNQCGHKFTTRA